MNSLRYDCTPSDRLCALPLHYKTLPIGPEVIRTSPELHACTDVYAFFHSHYIYFVCTEYSPMSGLNSSLPWLPLNIGKDSCTSERNYQMFKKKTRKKYYVLAFFMASLRCVYLIEIKKIWDKLKDVRNPDLSRSKHPLKNASLMFFDFGHFVCFVKC